jgi:hypothetical protein
VCNSATRLHGVIIRNTKSFTVTYVRTSQPAYWPYKLVATTSFMYHYLHGQQIIWFFIPITTLSQVSYQSPVLCTLQTALCGVPYPVRRHTEAINTWPKLDVALPVGWLHAVIQLSTQWESHLPLSGRFFERHNCITGDRPKFLCFLTFLYMCQAFSRELPLYYDSNTRNSPTRCNSFTSLLLDVYVWINMFRASPRPSSGAYNYTRSLWYYRWTEADGALLVVVCQTTTNNAPTVSLQR